MRAKWRKKRMRRSAYKFKTLERQAGISLFWPLSLFPLQVILSSRAVPSTEADIKMSSSVAPYAMSTLQHYIGITDIWNNKEHVYTASHYFKIMVSWRTTYTHSWLKRKRRKMRQRSK